MKNLLITLGIVLGLTFFLGGFGEMVFGADSGFEFPGTAVNDATVGTVDWVEVVGTGDTLIQAISADGGGMLHPTGVRISGAVTESSIKLVIGGVVAGDNKSTGAGFTTGIKTYGGATDLWGLTPTVAQINASNFGYAISLVGNGGTSKYLMVTNFGFTIPTGATINGVEVANDIENPAGAPRWDYIQIKVYYTEAPAVSETASTTIRDGSIHVRDGNLQIRN